MDASDRLIVCVVDWDDASWLIELVSWQLCLFFVVQKFTLIQIASVVVTLSVISDMFLSEIHMQEPKKPDHM